MEDRSTFRGLTLAWPIVVVATTYLYFFAGSYFGVYAPEVRSSSVVLLAIAFTAWTILAVRSRRWRPQSVLLPPILIALAVLAISTLLSRNLRVSLDYLGYAVLLAGLYLLLRQLMVMPELRRRMTGLVVILSIVLLVAYTAAVLAKWITWWGFVGHLAIPPLRPAYEGLSFGNPGVVAALTVMGYLITVAHLGLATRRAVAWLAVHGVWAGAVVLVTGSRASWVAIAVLLVAVVVTGALHAPTRARARMLLGRRSSRTIALLALVAMVVAAVVVGPRIVNRFLEGGTEAERASFAIVSLRMAASHPIAGIGPGMWAPDRIAFTLPPETDYYIPHAHNLVTQTLSELGLLGVVAGAVVIAFGFVLVRRAIRDGDGERRRWGWITAAVTVYLTAHQMLDLLIGLPTVLFVLAVPWAWIDAAERRPLVHLQTGRARLPLLGAAAVVAALALGWSWTAERSAVLMNAAEDVGKPDISAARNLLEEADRVDPRMPAHLLPLGLSQASSPDKALETFVRLSDSDDLPTAWLDRAALEAQSGDADAARRSIERSLRLGYQQPGVLLAAGWLYEQLGDPGAADRAYTDALILEPRLARDGFWHAAERAARWGDIREGALAALNDAGRVNLLLSEDAEPAADAIAGLDLAAAGPAVPLVVAAWDDPGNRAEALYEYTRANPQDLQALAWAARVAARSGDLDRAQDYRDWTDIVWANTSASGAEVKIEFAPPANAPHVGLNSVAWGIYTYRRPTPRDQLLPWLPHMVLTQ